MLFSGYLTTTEPPTPDDTFLSCKLTIPNQEFQKIIMEIFSSHDVSKNAPERVYHAFVLGLFASLRESYEIKSNRESRLGRFDVCLFPKNLSDLGIILEFKKAKKNENLKTLAASAILQIEDLHYVTELRSRNIQKILALGMAFHSKTVAIQGNFF